jgi:tripartite-type tricarboxylate transporter receptor subunit TctC
MMKRIAFAALAFAAAALPAAAADTWPSKPVKIIVPFGPGGFTDVVARILQKELAPALGQPIIIENRPGAGSTIGTDAVAKSPPDGYTLVMVSTTHVISPHLYKKMTYDPVKDFAPVMKLVEGPYVMVVHPSLGVSSVRDFIALAKRKPNEIFFASSGNGSAQHLVGALFMQMAGVQLSHVPYKGSNAAMQDLLGGQVKVSFVGMPNALPNLGKLKALAVTTRKRSPREIVDKLNADIRKVLADPEASQLMHKAGVEVATSTPEEFQALLQEELDRWGKVVKSTGAVVN